MTLINDPDIKLWPVHLKPKDDELLSSWLVRLANAHGLNPYIFCSISLPTKDIWGPASIDQTRDMELLKMLANRTNTSLDKVASTTLASYEGWLYDNRSRKGVVSWIMPRSNIRHRHQKHFGLQFCPLCLSEDEMPYFRRHWRLSFVVLCVKHKTLLLDRCANCGEGVNFYLNASNLGRKHSDPIVVCHKCEFDLRDVSVDTNHHVNSSEIKFQEFLMSVLKQGWVNIPEAGPIYSHLYFDALHQLLSVLAANDIKYTKGQNLREAIIQYYSLSISNPILAGKLIYFERLSVTERQALLLMLQCLLENWPVGFIEFCKAHKISETIWFRHLRYIPFWYWRVVHENLNGKRYRLSDLELASIISYLRRSGQRVGRRELSTYMSSSVSHLRIQTWGLPKKTYKSRPHRYSDSVRQEVVHLHLKGKTYKDIAQMMSLAKRTVYEWIKAHRVSLHNEQ